MTEESPSSAIVPNLISSLLLISISINTLIINSLELLIKLITIQLYSKFFYHIREQPYASTDISNIKSKYICLNIITDILITTKL